ncbi:GNAT family N-acetyltransferase [Candidatus Woesearchaeota archaeon]|nr:GNAT family N-acetyltransferase [Candidatus Woesearchaeota archaeon]
MGFSFNFREVGSERDVREVIDFLASQPLGYPNYPDWVQRTEAELFSGYKQAVLAYNEGTLVGDIVHQPHKYIPRVREIKNIRVHPDLRERGFARFMLRQVEVDARDGNEAVVVDTRKSNDEMIEFLKRCGYFHLITVSLYDSTEEDITFIRPLTRREGLIERVSADFVNNLR